MPYFSIIMPAFNREKEIRRAIQSCLDQDFADFELIVTDDGSSDGTASVVEQSAARDHRIRLLRHARNRGVCPARNTAARTAQGQWLVQLDSDMSLRPGGLTTLARLTGAAPTDVGEVATRIAWDTGIITPQPGIPAESLDCRGYVAWVETLSAGEWLNCIRREVFSGGVTWPESRAFEHSFHLGLASAWRFQICPEVCGVYHTDAENRICAPKDPRVAKQRLARQAYDHAVNFEEILDNYGDVLAECGPRQFFSIHYKAALNWFFAGYRVAGLRHACHCLRLRPGSLQAWSILVFGLMGPRAVLQAYHCVKHVLPELLAKKAKDAPREQQGPSGIGPPHCGKAVRGGAASANVLEETR